MQIKGAVFKIKIIDPTLLEAAMVPFTLSFSAFSRSASCFLRAFSSSAFFFPSALASSAFLFFSALASSSRFFFSASFSRLARSAEFVESAELGEGGEISRLEDDFFLLFLLFLASFFVCLPWRNPCERAVAEV